MGSEKKDEKELELDAQSLRERGKRYAEMFASALKRALEEKALKEKELWRVDDGE